MIAGLLLHCLLLHLLLYDVCYRELHKLLHEVLLVAYQQQVLAQFPNHC